MQKWEGAVLLVVTERSEDAGDCLRSVVPLGRPCADSHLSGIKTGQSSRWHLPVASARGLLFSPFFCKKSRQAVLVSFQLL